MRKFLIIIIILLCTKIGYSQYAATLSAGINQLTGSKGTIDVELLSELVASKQDELKKEVVKNFILKNVGNSNFTYYSYAYNTLDLLLNERNVKTITQNTIENTANLALVYAFAEYYLQTEWNCAESDTSFINVLNYLMSDFRYLSIDEQMIWNANLSSESTEFRPGLINYLKTTNSDEIKARLDTLSKNLKIFEKDFEKIEIVVIDSTNSSSLSSNTSKRDSVIERTVEIANLGEDRLFFDYPTHIEILLMLKAINAYKFANQELFEKNMQTKTFKLISETVKNDEFKQEKLDVLLMNQLVNDLEPVLMNWENFTLEISQIDKSLMMFEDLSVELNNLFINDSVFKLTDYEKNFYEEVIRNGDLFKMINKYNIYKTLANKLNDFSNTNEFEKKQQYIDGFASYQIKNSEKEIVYSTKNSPEYDSLLVLGQSYYDFVKDTSCFWHKTTKLEFEKDSVIFDDRGLGSAKDTIIESTKFIVRNEVYKQVVDTATAFYEDYLFQKNFFEKIYFAPDSFEISEDEKQYFINKGTNSTGKLSDIYVYINIYIDLITEQKKTMLEANKKIDTLRNNEFADNILKDFKKIEEKVLSKTNNRYTNAKLKEDFDYFKKQLAEIKDNNCDTLVLGLNECLIKLGIELDKQLKLNIEINQSEFDWYKDLMYYRIVTNRVRDYDVYSDLLLSLDILYSDSIFSTDMALYKKIKENSNYYNILSLFDTYKPYIEAHDLYKDFQYKKEYWLELYNVRNYNLTVSSDLLNDMIEMYDFYYKLQIINQLEEKLTISKNYFDMKDRKYVKTNLQPPTPLNLIIIDMVFDICKNNQEILEKGFFNQPNIVSDDEYKIQNLYLNLEKTDPMFFEVLQPLYSSMETKITTLFKFYQLIKEMNLFGGNDILSLKSKYTEKIIETFKDTADVKKFDIEKWEKLNEEIDSVDNILDRISILSDSIYEITWYLEELSSESPNPDSKIFNDIFDKSENQLILLTNYSNGLYEFQTLRENFLSNIKIYEYKEAYKNSQNMIKLLGSQKQIVYDYLIQNSDYKQNNLDLFYESIKNFNPESLDPKDHKFAVKSIAYIKSLEKENAEDFSFNILSYVRDSIIPELVVINSKYKTRDEGREKYSNIEIEMLENIVNYGYYNEIDKFLNSEITLSSDMISHAREFIEVISRLNQLDQVETYEYILRTLTDAGNSLTDKKGITAFNSLINGTMTYLSVDEKNNTMSFDVEAMILKLYDKYEKLNTNWMAMYFSVGLNQNIILSKEIIDNQTTAFPKFAFASEKIGVKIVPPCMNLKYQRDTKFITGKDVHSSPLINDYHFIFYGSGLLYNIVNTTTDENFKSPVIGAGFGLTFYNSMDFNLTYSIPMSGKPFESSMIGLSFDIKITEYLNAMYKKRMETKLKKYN